MALQIQKTYPRRDERAAQFPLALPTIMGYTTSRLCGLTDATGNHLEKHGGWGDGGQAELGPWIGSIRHIGLKVDLDGGAVAVWALRDASLPADASYQVRLASWPPGTQFEPPVALSDWHNYAWVGGMAFVLGRFGTALAVSWMGQRMSVPSTAIFYSKGVDTRHRVCLPVMLRNWP